MKKYISPSQYYELYIPDDWGYSQDDNLVNFYNEEAGVGALQISSYLVGEDYDVDIVTELSEIVSEKIGVGQYEVASQITLLENSGFFTFINDNKYWEYYMFFKRNKLLLITYNCGEIDRLTEKDIIDKIIRSLIIN